MTNETTKSIEELEAEAKAAQDALNAKQEELRKQQQAIEDQKREEEHKLQKEIQNAKDQKLLADLRQHMVKIQAELEAGGVLTGMQIKEGFVGGYRPIYPSLDLPFAYQPEFSERRRGGSSWRIGTLVGYNIVVGDYGERKTFPPKKDGSYSYDKIAREIERRVNAARRDQSIEEQRRDMTAEANEIAKMIGGSVVTSGYDSRGRWSQKTPTITLSLTEARALLGRIHTAAPEDSAVSYATVTSGKKIGGSGDAKVN